MGNTNRLFGVPNETMRQALREEMEMMGLGDEEIRKALQAHALVDLFNAVQMIILKPDSEHCETMRKWLRGEVIPSSKQLAKDTLAEVKGILNATKATLPHRGPRAGSTRRMV